MAELVRRGLEYMLATSPGSGAGSTEWELPEALDLQSQDPFSDPGWREQVHMQHLRVAETPDPYCGEDPQ